MNAYLIYKLFCFMKPQPTKQDKVTAFPSLTNEVSLIFFGNTINMSPNAS